jgi:hypothetical protein
LRSIPTPIPVFDGAKEEAIDRNQTKLMVLLIPGAELVINPDTDRFALFERPAESVRIVEAFLAV